MDILDSPEKPRADGKRRGNGIPKNGITDSLDEVAQGVITVKNNLKDLDPSQLATITEQAINMEKVFGSDMNETMRGVNALMVNFGLDAQTAMDMVVRGTQNGLDKDTGSSGDNLSEYSGVSQAGYSRRRIFPAAGKRTGRGSLQSGQGK